MQNGLGFRVWMIVVLAFQPTGNTVESKWNLAARLREEGPYNYIMILTGGWQGPKP